ncbi:peptidase inhibitor family I36 protein [Ectopseudomonas khazarica]|uniref:peptidase inhibitor family I36 protein n=1 Tax=Ectopseudomonas khazarica TaxID=2502979 RepID=UPI0009DEEE60|nr:peptidase inhibitor family I36 protein [Pseudomonas khazarica]QTS87750.1 peptidase inhibitor family I36 protein [Pseudomonas khazarica]
MSTSTFVTFYKSQEYKDALQPTYTGPQAQSSPDISGVSSIETGSETWLIVYQGKSFDGDAMQLGPNTRIYDLTKVHTNRGNGNWDNQISSFVMYDHKPSFWASGATRPELDLQDGEIIFAENTDFEGDCKIYRGTNYAGDLNNCQYGTNGTNRDLKNNISSLATGTNAWLEVYDQPDYRGEVLKVHPSTEYRDLASAKRGSVGNWSNQLQSFRCFYSTSEPASWFLGLDESLFKSLYLDNYSDSTLNGNAIGYRTQDAQYRIYDPVVDYPDVDTMAAAIQIDHIISASTDDHTNLVLTFNTNRELVQVSQDWQAGSAYQVPSWVIKTVDIGAEVLGALGALESAGISEAAANEFVETFDAACKTFNKICQVIANLSESDGGRFYMIPVSCHTIVRACLAVANSESGGGTPINFDHQAVARMLGGNWQQWKGTTGELNQSLEYRKGDYSYRTWYQELSVMRQNAGMLVTCKVDFVHSIYDDHVILMVGFMATAFGPCAVFAQASIQFHVTDDSDFSNILGEPIYSTADAPISDLGQAVADSLASQLAGMDFGSNDNNQARATLPDIAKLNVNIIIEATNNG